MQRYQKKLILVLKQFPIFVLYLGHRLNSYHQKLLYNKDDNSMKSKRIHVIVNLVVSYNSPYYEAFYNNFVCFSSITDGLCK